MTDRDIKEMIFAHKPELRFKRVSKLFSGFADDDDVGIVIFAHSSVDTRQCLPAWDIREPRPPWADAVLVAARWLLTHRYPDRFNEKNDDDAVVVCFAHIR